LSDIEFPKIIIDYDQNIGDIVDIIRAGKTWHITFIYSNGNVNALVKPPEGDDISIDITSIKDEPTVVQLTIAQVLMSIVYSDYSDELKAMIIAGPKRANMTQKTFDTVIIQPQMAEDDSVISPWWQCVFSQDGIALCNIKRHYQHPDVFHIFFPNAQSCFVIYKDEDDGTMKLGKPSQICNSPNDYIDLTITPEVVP
jgi:hypothetical protein